MDINELKNILETKFKEKIKGAHCIGNRFFAPRMNAQPTWAKRAIKIEDDEIIIGHISWNFDNVSGSVAPADYPWSDEERTTFEPMIKFSVINGESKGRDIIFRYLELPDTA